MVKQLYNVALRERIQPGESPGRGAELTSLGALASDDSAVEQLLTDPPDVRLREGYLHPGEYARPGMIADELRELSGSALGAIPLFRPGDTYKDSGFYEISAGDVSPAHAAARNVWEYDIRLERAGSRGASVRRLSTASTTETHPFGSGTSADLAVPDSARGVRWYNSETRESTVATSSGTAGSAQGTLAEYPLSDAPDSNTEDLVYDIPYSDDVVGCRVYDSRGNSDKLDSNSIRQWQTVFDTTHDQTPDAPTILSNGRTRLRVDVPTAGGTGTVETADWGAGSWGAWTDITPADHDPLDLDLIDIDQQRVEAQLLFVSDTGSSTYAVNLSLTPGYADPLVYPAPSESTGIPSDIDSAFSGTARTSEKRTQATRTLVSREAVRR